MKPKTEKKFKNGRFGKNNPNYGNYKFKENESEIINLHLLGLNCVQIAKKFNCYSGTIRELLKRNNIKLSTGHKLNKHPNWKNGRLISRGYVYLRKPNHPNANKAGYVAEHRLAMEKFLGRYLNKNEVVHHKDGNRGNNIIDNLEVLDTNREHFKNFHQLERDKLGRFKKIYV
jgi:hypothetical protein